MLKYCRYGVKHYPIDQSWLSLLYTKFVTYALVSKRDQRNNALEIYMYDLYGHILAQEPLHQG